MNVVQVLADLTRRDNRVDSLLDQMLRAGETRDELVFSVGIALSGFRSNRCVPEPCVGNLDACKRCKDSGKRRFEEHSREEV